MWSSRPHHVHLPGVRSATAVIFSRALATAPFPRIGTGTLADGTLAVSDADAKHWRRRLAVSEGLYVGYSAAANVCAVSALLASGVLGKDAVVVTILCDSGLKY